jgi:hypothetical protein
VSFRGRHGGGAETADHTYALSESLSIALTLSPKPPALVADSESAYTSKRIVLTSPRNWCSVEKRCLLIGVNNNNCRFKDSLCLQRMAEIVR